MTEKGIEVRFRHRLGSLELNVDFSSGAAWTVLFGPSGSGKSTVLRVIAGLERPSAGQVRLRGEFVQDSDAGIWTSAARRPIRWAAQRAMLFPHKTVRENVMLGIDANDHDVRDRRWLDRDVLLPALEHFGLLGMADKLPDELSGGQRQLVAVVRSAVGARKRVLLLDEPFAGLDAEVRDQLIGNLRGWLGDSPVVSVTHDVGEAFLLDGEVIRIAAGRVVAQGPVTEVLAEERARLLRVLGPGRD